jgi:AcrR family transcriptional regulator
VRAERTREAVVDALLAMLDEGVVRPTAEQIAIRAGVSERTIFGHFPDREALFEAVATRQYERVVPKLLPISRRLPLAARIEAFVAQRAWLLETISGVRRGAVLIESESPVVAENLRRVRAAKAAEVARVFGAELRERPPEVGEALVCVTSWVAWDGLRSHQELDPDAARDAMRAAVRALLGA